MSAAAVFLDRDGTINERAAPHRYIEDAVDFRWLPGAAQAIAALAGAGLTPVVVSNQRGVARGLVSDATLREIERRMQRDLLAHGTQIEAFHYCRHDLDADCDCRKPRPGMLVAAARRLDLDLARSWMIGDSVSDVAAGEAAGCRTALIAECDEAGCAPTLRAASLAAAARAILSDGDPGRA